MNKDALGPCVNGPSADIVLNNMQDKCVLVFYNEGFKLLGPTQCREIIENVNHIIYNSSNKITRAGAYNVDAWPSSPHTKIEPLAHKLQYSTYVSPKPKRAVKKIQGPESI